MDQTPVDGLNVEPSAGRPPAPMKAA
jgi:hypothetical protein